MDNKILASIMDKLNKRYTMRYVVSDFSSNEKALRKMRNNING